jgi:hypothetical protein
MKKGGHRCRHRAYEGKTGLTNTLLKDLLSIGAIQIRTEKRADEIKGWFDPQQDRYFSASEAMACGLADGFFELPNPTGFVAKA